MEQQLNLFDTIHGAQHANSLSAIIQSFEALVAKVKELGYSVRVKNACGKKVITWSTRTHFASATFDKNSESDLQLVCQKLTETTYCVSVLNQNQVKTQIEEL